MGALGSKNIDARYPGSPLHPKHGRGSYLFNSSIAGIEDADAILIVGSNPRREAAVLNARIRKRYLKGGLAIGVVGEHADLTYPYAYLGAGPESIAEAAAKILVGKEKPMLIIGQGALNRADGAAVLAALAALAASSGVVKDGWNGFNILHTEAALVGALDIGFVPGEGGLDTAGMMQSGALDVLYLLGVDEIEVPEGAFVIYQGTHGDKGAHRADVILPGAAFSEKSGLYVNTEGRVQLGNRAVFPLGEAREDWSIIRALSAALGKTLPFDTLTALRKALYAAHPHFAVIGAVAVSDAGDVAKLGKLSGKPSKEAFHSPVKDFHLTNAVARASKIMADCSALASSRQTMAAE
jgi:NADH-quinone oxidoreductase subunit G